MSFVTRNRSENTDIKSSSTTPLSSVTFEKISWFA